METCLTSCLCVVLSYQTVERTLDWQSAELDLPLATGATTFTSYMTFTSLHFSSSTSTMDKILSSLKFVVS